jgi:hypothetical protein
MESTNILSSFWLFNKNQELEGFMLGKVILGQVVSPPQYFIFSFPYHSTNAPYQSSAIDII